MDKPFFQYLEIYSQAELKNAKKTSTMGKSPELFCYFQNNFTLEKL